MMQLWGNTPEDYDVWKVSGLSRKATAPRPRQALWRKPNQRRMVR